MLAGPEAEERLERSFDIVDYLSFIGPTLTDDWSALPSPLDLSEGEKFDIYRALDETEFIKGVTAKKAQAILGRLNEYHDDSHHHHHQSESSSSSSRIVVPPQNSARVHLESVLPENYYEADSGWSVEEANDWMHRLGNLVLVNKKSKETLADRAFCEKKECLKQSQYPLTRNVAEFSQWTPKSAKTCHEDLLLLARKVWDL
jgi:hypothetical protein